MGNVTGAGAGALVEGFIDLLFEDDNGFAIADYKTDAVDGEGAPASAAERYGMQAGLYALAIEQVTGKPVKEVVLVFVHASKELRFEDVAALRARVQAKTQDIVDSTLLTRASKNSSQLALCWGTSPA